MSKEDYINELMTDIRKEIKEKNITFDIPSFETIPIVAHNTDGKSINQKVCIKQRILNYAYYNVFLKTPYGFQRFIKRITGR